MDRIVAEEVGFGGNKIVFEYTYRTNTTFIVSTRMHSTRAYNLSVDDHRLNISKLKSQKAMLISCEY